MDKLKEYLEFKFNVKIKDIENNGDEIILHSYAKDIVKRVRLSFIYNVNSKKLSYSIIEVGEYGNSIVKGDATCLL